MYLPYEYQLKFAMKPFNITTQALAFQQASFLARQQIIFNITLSHWRE